MRLWPLGCSRRAGARVGGLLLRLYGEKTRRDALGVRNQRMLALHRAVVGRPIEAVVGCPGCNADNEFVVPVDEICALPGPSAEAAVRLKVGDSAVRFRLPMMADLEALAGSSYATGIRRLAARTCLESDPPSLDAAGLTRLAQEWEALDPAGSIRVDLSCAECTRAIAANVDPAEFVARDLDRTVEGLLRDVDVIARAYGWSEDAILGLAAERRRWYVGLIDLSPRSPGRHLKAVAP
ncbi:MULTISPECIES: hypothetical protein [unclassified Micromonospora]|uniref:hypothetical protein n=1 Tax=unclassified Micromonospora TaxID=2617518 RepID=UPI002FF185FA